VDRGLTVRHFGWFLILVALLGALFWPFLLLAAGFMLIAMVVGLLTRGGKR
jgi:hypothetical protein